MGKNTLPQLDGLEGLLHADGYDIASGDSRDHPGDRDVDSPISGGNDGSHMAFGRGLDGRIASEQANRINGRLHDGSRFFGPRVVERPEKYNGRNRCALEPAAGNFHPG